MKRRYLLPILAAVLLLIAFLLLRPRAQHASLLLVNGKIYTLESDRPAVEALAVVDDRIGGTGSTGELQERFEADTVIDLGGRPAYPGFIDAHAHLEGIGVALTSLNLVGKSLQEVTEVVRAEAQRCAPGQWIRGRGWDQNLWKGKAFPSHTDLDAASPEVPVYLVRVDGHAAWVNRKVLDLAGISRSTPDPPGGRLLRDARGEPTGVFVDNAMDLIAGLFAEPSTEERTEAIRRAIQHCLRLGITQIHDMGADLGRIDIYKALASRGDFPFRVYVAFEGTDRKAVEKYIASGPDTGLYGGRVTVRAIKLYADGALGSRGAALIEPYSDDPGNRGLTITEAEELELASRMAMEKGFQICVHAIGDRANSIVLSTFEKVFNSLKVKGMDQRFRVEHAQVLSPDDIPKFRRLGILPSMQPVHCTSDMPWAVERLGAERARGAYAWRSLLEAGSTIAGGSDAPVEDPDIIRNFYAAITRQRLDGTPEGGWNAPERMSREEALKSFTLWASYAAFEEEKKGSLRVGKWADVVVLSEDILTSDVRKIPEIEVDMTVVGGKVVFCRGGAR